MVSLAPHLPVRLLPASAFHLSKMNWEIGSQGDHGSLIQNQGEARTAPLAYAAAYADSSASISRSIEKRLSRSVRRRTPKAPAAARFR